MLRETQTLRAGCSKVEPKNFAQSQTPFPGVRDGQNLISWRWSLPLPTNPVWWGSIHAISSYHGKGPTPPATNRVNYNTLHRSLARSVIRLKKNRIIKVTVILLHWPHAGSRAWGPSGLRGWKNTPTLFTGQISGKVTKPGSVCPLS